jgi:alkylated DNA repair dioxygenase AlkB
MFQPKATAPILRETLWYAKDKTSYFYSGSYNLSLDEPHDAVMTMADQLSSSVSQLLGIDAPIGGYLINRYKDGTQKINHHSDNEPELGTNPVIISVSLGATRNFQLKAINQKKRSEINIALEHGDVLVMAGETQQHYTHALPQDLTCTKERINITFRPHLPELRQAKKKQKTKK